MKKTIKLKDLTKNQWICYRKNICTKIDCKYCPFEKVICSEVTENDSWVNNKDLFSDKFLNREITMEVEDVLTEEEREYLSIVIKPYKNHIVRIIKEIDNKESDSDNLLLVIFLKEHNVHTPMIPLFKNEKGEYAFAGMKMHLEYRLSDLGLDDD